MSAQPTEKAPEANELQHRYSAAYANALEERWQASLAWPNGEGYGFRQPNPGEAGFDASKPKFYCLDMFPYPSGAGLHVGHPEGYTATDILCRYKKLKGFNVLHPMGWDAFGLPAEQYAIQTGVHPEVTTKKAIDNFRRQLRRFGFMYDWSREFATIDPDYYRWTQWIWLQAYSSWFDPAVKKARRIAELEAKFAREDSLVTLDGGVAKKWSACTKREKQAHLDTHRLAYLGTQTVNWCPKLGTVLANEEVIDGRSERGGFPVLRMPLKQWMFRITAYADRLLEDLAHVDWPDMTRTLQTEWIGRSEGAEIRFAVDGESEPLIVFTTRPDTIFGATYMVVAPEHPLVARALARDAANTKLAEYVAWAKNRSDIDRQASKEKTGCATGLFAVNPATGARIPVWTADYVLMGYGTGAIMAVPAHDERDFEFAKAFGLAIQQVVEIDGSPFTGDTATAGEGRAVNSANAATVSIDGLSTADAKRAVIAWLEKSNLGARRVNYRLRDWLFSRQRYWGEPFPIVFDEEGNHYPVSASQLPVVLPPLADYSPIESDTPQPPLAKAREWTHTTAGAAGVDPALLAPDTPVVRETNTMPGWAGSCWYYLRYSSPKDASRFVSPEAERYWMLSRKKSAASAGVPTAYDPATCHTGGVDLYVGGSEHAVLHCLYARFWHKMLFDLGHVSTPEPFGKLFHQGLITSYAFQRADRSLVPTDQVTEVKEGEFVETATGEKVTQIVAKMSKSLKNVVNPDEVIADYGADTFRLYEMYMGPLEASKPWNTRDIVGVFRFLQRAWRLAVDERTGELLLAANADAKLEKLLHRTIHKVGDDIEKLSFNTAIAAMIEFVNAATRPQSMTDPTQGGLTRDQLAHFATILWPFAPHIADEIGAKLGLSGTTAEGVRISIATQPWPAVDPMKLVDDEVEMPVQIQGKIKARLMVPAKADAAAVEALALAHADVVAAIAGRPVKKVVVVPGRMVNIVV
ncbi:MAG: leucine--tRNA ligase [Phycisphaera sp.]|nr:leucine--tRNA ligase [Phycisphaera sp.]